VSVCLVCLAAGENVVYLFGELIACFDAVAPLKHIENLCDEDMALGNLLELDFVVAFCKISKDVVLGLAASLFAESQSEHSACVAIFRKIFQDCSDVAGGLSENGEVAAANCFYHLGGAECLIAVIIEFVSKQNAQAVAVMAAVLENILGFNGVLVFALRGLNPQYEGKLQIGRNSHCILV